ncbi:EpsG family protein [Lutibacter maritimus]|uniref:EpsG family protein n=1 Tax=Lutibacter maritimus TaxID=593133 RepID=A0A1I6QMK4_9FLAO|nr:EpsG family protein [Lutibacter maritimus]SFS53669.1 EpsG family protein [Lutibacter maritimus]
MIIYLTLFLIATILYFSANRKTPSIGYYIFIGLLILVSGFRDMIGGYDVYIYGEVYEYINKYTYLRSTFEKGFIAYFIGLNYINGQREFMFFITALIMVLLHFYTIKKYSPILYMSAFIFFCKFFLMSFVYLRQGLAMGLVWLSIRYVIQKRYMPFVCIVLLAFFMHKSAILFLPFIVIAHKKLGPYQLFLITTASFIIAISPLGQLILNYFIEGIDYAKLNIYGEKFTAINVFYLLEAVLLAYLALKFRKHFYQSTPTIVIFNGFLLYVLIILISLTNATFVRLAWVFFIFVVVALPYMYTFITDFKLQRTFKIAIFVYYTFVFFRLLTVFDGGDFMPYKSIFQDFNRNGQWEFMEYR